MTAPTSEAAPRIQRASTAMGSEVADGFIVMDIENGNYFSFNGTAAEIWRAIEAPVTEAQIVDRLCARFEIDPETCRTKVAAFVERLADARIATTTDA